MRRALVAALSFIALVAFLPGASGAVGPATRPVENGYVAVTPLAEDGRAVPAFRVHLTGATEEGFVLLLQAVEELSERGEVLHETDLSQAAWAMERVPGGNEITLLGTARSEAGLIRLAFHEYLLVHNVLESTPEGKNLRGVGAPTTDLDVLVDEWTFQDGAAKRVALRFAVAAPDRTDHYGAGETSNVTLSHEAGDAGFHVRLRQDGPPALSFLPAGTLSVEASADAAGADGRVTALTARVVLESAGAPARFQARIHAPLGEHVDPFADLSLVPLDASAGSAGPVLLTDVTGGLAVDVTLPPGGRAFNLAPGEYRVTATGPGGEIDETLRLEPGDEKSLDLRLGAAPRDRDARRQGGSGGLQEEKDTPFPGALAVAGVAALALARSRRRVR